MLKNHSSFLKTTFLSAVILLSSSLMIGCGDDDGNDGPFVDPLVGQYLLSGATALSDASSTVSDVEISEGDDLLPQVSVALLSASPCGESDVTYVELEEDGTFDLVCRDSDESADGGTWSINEGRTALNLSLIQQSPSGPITVPVILNDFEDDGTTISGNISNLGLPLFLFDPDFINNPFQTIVVDVELEFTRVQ